LRLPGLQSETLTQNQDKTKRDRERGTEMRETSMNSHPVPREERGGQGGWGGMTQCFLTAEMVTVLSMLGNN
jgi:hypothetical protein